MKNTIIKFGLIAGTIVVVIPYIGGLITGTDPEMYRTGEIIGYSTMLLSLMTIFVAINEYKKSQPLQAICFKDAFIIGLGISTIAGAMFGLYNYIYASYIEPDFMHNYFNYYIENIRNSGAEQHIIEQRIAQLEQEKAFFMNPLVNFSVMFFTVFVLGLVISLIAAFIQSSKAAKKMESEA